MDLAPTKVMSVHSWYGTEIAQNHYGLCRMQDVRTASKAWENESLSTSESTSVSAYGTIICSRPRLCCNTADSQCGLTGRHEMRDWHTHTHTPWQWSLISAGRSIARIELKKFYNYETEKITHKASVTAEYIELFGSSTRDCHARHINVILCIYGYGVGLGEG